MRHRDPSGMSLPWSGETMPHAVLDLLRGCNVACSGCYNATAEFSPKPVAQLREELRQLMELRRLHAVSLTGGEPLLHPELDEIVRHVHDCGLRTVLMTNGLLLDEARARRLKAAGLDMVLLHVQNRQNRPDLPPGKEAEAVLTLRRAKIEIARQAGLDIGVSALMYADDAGFAEIRNLLAEVAASETVHFAMICPQGDFSIFSNLDGGIGEGYRQPRPVAGGLSSEESIAVQAGALYGILAAEGFGLFSWIGSSAADAAPRWTAWNAGVLQNSSGVRAVPLYPAWTDRLLLRLVQMISGRHLFYGRPSTGRFRFQLALSLLAPGRFKAALSLLAGSLRPDTRLHRKHVVVELPPAQRRDGTVLICGECPDATVLDGKLVPPCLLDRVPGSHGSGGHAGCHGAGAL